MPILSAKGRYPTNNTVSTGTERLRTTLEKKSLMEQISLFVDGHLAEKITLQMIASQFSVSVSTVTQLFQKKSQTTFHGFLTMKRMEKARDLILEGLPLESVGKAIGYRDHSTFYRAFRNAFGISPREYRKKVLAEAAE